MGKVVHRKPTHHLQIIIVLHLIILSLIYIYIYLWCLSKGDDHLLQLHAGPASDIDYEITKVLPVANNVHRTWPNLCGDHQWKHHQCHLLLTFGSLPVTETEAVKLPSIEKTTTSVWLDWYEYEEGKRLIRNYFFSSLNELMKPWGEEQPCEGQGRCDLHGPSSSPKEKLRDQQNLVVWDDTG